MSILTNDGVLIVPVPGYEEHYGATIDGRVFSFNYRRSGKTKELAQSILVDKRRDSKTFYKRAKMYHINANTPTAIHRVIALTFVKNPNNYNCVNHIDGNKGNNSSYNLEWCTNKHNIRHAEYFGLAFHHKGEDHHNAILTENQVKEIKKELQKPVYKGQLTDLGKKYGVSKHCIFDIKRGKSWAYLCK
jgi:hypothetical protein